MPRRKDPAPSGVHIHRYTKVVLSSRKDKGAYIVYKCNYPKCRHYIPKELLVGKEAICNRCGNKFIVTRDRLHGATNIFCRDCVKRKVQEEIPDIPMMMPLNSPED